MRFALLALLVTSTAVAAPKKLPPGQTARLKHIVDKAPAWAANCPLEWSDVTLTSKGFMLDVKCKGFETLMFSRESTPGDARALAGGLKGFYKGSKLEAVKWKLARGTVEGFALVMEDGRAYGVVLEQPAAGKLVDSYMCIDKKPAANRIAICREALDALARSTVAADGEAGYPIESD